MENSGKRQFNLWDLLLLLIRAVLFPLYKIPFVIVIIILGYYAFSINDQGQDLMATLASTNIFDNKYFSLFVLFLLFWAVAIWNVARVLLSAANVQKLAEFEEKNEELKKKIEDFVKNEESKKRIEEVEKNGELKKKKWKVAIKIEWVVVGIDKTYKRMLSIVVQWTPRFLAMSPYVIFICAYQKQNKLLGATFDRNLIVVTIIGFLHFLYVRYRRPLSNKMYRMFFPKKHPSNEEIKKEEVSEEFSIKEERNFMRAFKKERIVINSFITLLITIIMFICSVRSARDVPSIDGQPGLIVLTGFTVYTLIGFFFNLLLNRWRIPVFLLLVLFAVFVASKFNNNHTIQTLATEADKRTIAARHNFHDTAYFDYWMEKKFDNHIFDTSSKKKETIFIVAAEGGGIRNCYWTYRVLNELQKSNPDFYNKTFAVTGVSGGSIGVGFYYNFKYYFDSLSKKGHKTEQLENKLDSICSADYLSRVTFAFMFPDFLQRFIPARIDRWDRSKYLANSFDDAFSYFLSYNNEKLLSNNYLKMWADTSTAYKYPVMLFNTIFNEDGTKAIFSPYRLSDLYYAGAMDLLYECNRSVPMKEAMVSSARFPILSAPGLVWHDTIRINKAGETGVHLDSMRLGHISDGGGFENTGIQTIEQTAMLILDRLKAKKLSEKINVQIIYIGTGADSIEIVDKSPVDRKRYRDPIGKSYELAWLNGSANTIFGWIKSSHNMAVRLNPKLTVLQFGLRVQESKESHRLPLGWYLSRQSKGILENQSTYKNASTNFKISMDAFRKL